MGLEKNVPGVGADGNSEVIFHSPMVNYRNKPVKNRSITRAAFDKRRIPRRLALEIVKSKLPNLHCCGVANYLWLLCSGQTYRLAGTDAPPGCFAFLERPIAVFQEAFQARSKKSCLDMLDQLKGLGLIGYSYDRKTHSIAVSIIGRPLKDTKRKKKIGYEISAIKKGLGYVPVSKSKMEKVFAPAGHCSVRDALVFLWLHAVYNDTQFPASTKAAVVALNSYPGYFTLELSSQSLSKLWSCSKASVFRILEILEKAEFITSCRKYGRCLVLSVNHYAEWLWDNPSGTLTDEDVEVLILGRDPDPDIREEQKEFLKLVSIAGRYEKKKSLSRHQELCAQLVETTGELLERKYLRHDPGQYLRDVRSAERALKNVIPDCPRNRPLQFTMSAVFAAARARVSQDSQAA